MTASTGALSLSLRRNDTARNVYRFVTTAQIPLPSILKPAGRFVYELRSLSKSGWRRVKALLWYGPLFRCRCDAAGKRLSLIECPSVNGHAAITVGDDLRLSGSLLIASGRMFEQPELRIGNRVFIGHNVAITCNRMVEIGDDVLIASDCRISDCDGHPIDFTERVEGLPARAESVQPVRIGQGAWIGQGSFILKGVTIGQGGIVGANSVVTHDVPAFAIVGGSPARLVEGDRLAAKS